MSEDGDVSKRKVLGATKLLNEVWILLKVVMASSGHNILVFCSFLENTLKRNLIFGGGMEWD